MADDPEDELEIEFLTFPADAKAAALILELASEELSLGRPFRWFWAYEPPDEESVIKVLVTLRWDRAAMPPRSSLNVLERSLAEFVWLDFLLESSTPSSNTTPDYFFWGDSKLSEYSVCSRNYGKIGWWIEGASSTSSASSSSSHGNSFYGNIY